jgi:hypothetical protein
VISGTNTGRTLAGTFTTTRLVQLEHIILPEFHRSRRVNFQECHVFAAECPYDIIVGRDFLQKTQMVFDFEAMTLSAFGNIISMKNKHFHDNPFESLIDIVSGYDNDDDENEIASSYHTETKSIKESTYKKADLDLLVKQQNHLSVNQKTRLLSILSK